MSHSIAVSDRDGLLAALAEAKGGETIFLQGGDYGGLQFTRGELHFAETVKIISADPEDPAIFTQMDIRGASSLTFDGIVFDYRFQEGDPLFTSPFRIWNCDDILIVNSRLSGDVAHGSSAVNNGFATAIGLNVRDSSGITVSASEIEGFYRGLTFSRSDDVAVTGNNIHSIRMDGMNFASSQGVLIEGNHIHNFNRSLASGDHADMIQFHTNGTTTPSTDIVIRGNLLDSGAGEYTQSIFMRNEEVDQKRAGSEMFYRNVLIEDNVIINSQIHGISLGETDGVVIRNNSVLQVETPTPGMTSASVSIPRISVNSASTNVEIVQNVTSNIVGHRDQPDWVMDGNIFVQNSNPQAPNWYGDIFVTSSLHLNDGHHNYILRPGGEIDLAGAGASALRRPAGEAIFTTEASSPNGPEVVFDAALFAGLHLPGTTYLWDFGDGTSASGPLVSQRFAYAGQYEVTLTQTCPVAGVSTARSTVSVQAAEYLRLGDDGQFVRNDFGQLVQIETANATAEGHLALGVTSSLSRSLVRPMLAEDTVELNFAIRAAEAGNTGEIVRLHSAFLVSVEKSGAIVARAWTSEGSEVRLTSTGVPVNDGEVHAVGLRLAEGKLSLWVNDTLLAARDFEGTFRDQGRHDLTFGNPWSGTGFKGELTEFAIILPAGAPTAPPVPEAGSVILEDAAPADPAPVVPDITHGPLELGGGGIISSISRAELSDLFKLDDIGISFTLDATSAGMTGEVFRLHSSFLVAVNKAGEVDIRAWSSEGDAVRLVSTGVKVNDGETHDIDIQLSGGKLSLFVNDTIVAERGFNGAFRDQGRHDLTFGNPWDGEGRFFNGELAEFGIFLRHSEQEDPFSAHAEFADMPMI